MILHRLILHVYPEKRPLFPIDFIVYTTFPRWIFKCIQIQIIYYLAGYSNVSKKTSYVSKYRLYITQLDNQVYPGKHRLYPNIYYILPSWIFKCIQENIVCIQIQIIYYLAGYSSISRKTLYPNIDYKLHSWIFKCIQENIVSKCRLYITQLDVQVYPDKHCIQI